VVNGAVYTLPCDLRQDLVPIVLLPSNPQLIVSNNAIPAKDRVELIAWIKLRQATVSAGTGGAGTAAHVSGVYFENITGTHFQFAPIAARVRRCKTSLRATSNSCLTNLRKRFRTFARA
jgi:tripartite-type tricarboxylate transporter receptor subunit TctC